MCVREIVKIERFCAVAECVRTECVCVREIVKIERCCAVAECVRTEYVCVCVRERERNRED